MHAAAQPTLSVVVPFFNASATLGACIAPLREMLARGEIDEVIMVDDGSTDRSAELVRSHPELRLLQRPVRGGPGAARNSAAGEARGEYLWFVDADVVLADDAARVLRSVIDEGRPQAVIGSYDDAPKAANFLSQYKNLVHAYYHHRGRRKASTFWAGCGAVQRDLFRALGGFDAARYAYPSIEDIELGYRICAGGGAIVLEPALQGKHLKEWRLGNLLHTEIFRRAIPWSRLMLERKQLTDDLNVGKSERLRAALAAACLLALLAALSGWIGWALPALLLASAALANHALIAFFARRGGALFALGGFLFHQLYYLYSSAAFAFAAISHLLAPTRLEPERRRP
jgi:glycosyltransferase involved in cell wall biosynthesis